MEKTVRCTVCESEFTDTEIEGAESCPMCKSKSVPCLISNDVFVKINWHELRILGIWADNYAASLGPEHNDSKFIVSKIIRRLEKQYSTMSAITLGGELKRVEEEFGVKVVRFEDENFHDNKYTKRRIIN